jgi:hypothetical protein
MPITVRTSSASPKNLVATGQKIDNTVVMSSEMRSIVIYGLQGKTRNEHWPSSPAGVETLFGQVDLEEEVFPKFRLNMYCTRPLDARCRAARDKSDGGRPGTFWLAAVDDRALHSASCLEWFPLLERSYMQECCCNRPNCAPYAPGSPGWRSDS